MPGYCDDKRIYIDAVRDFTLPDKIVYTEALSDVMRDISEGHRDICVTGPKGCGKSIIAAVLFLILSKDCCMYLTQSSCESIAYIRQLYQEYTTTDPSMYVRNLLKKRKYILIDFGTCPTNGSALDFLLKIWKTFGEFTKVISLSSGYEMASSNRHFPKEIHKLYSQISFTVQQQIFNVITITGFTNEEAARFIGQIMELDKDEITKLGGTNPLLLSLAQGCHTIHEYSNTVHIAMQSFLSDNLTIFSDVKSVSGYFTTCQWETGCLYIYLVLQDEEFTSNQLRDYEST